MGLDPLDNPLGHAWPPCQREPDHTAQDGGLGDATPAAQDGYWPIPIAQGQEAGQPAEGAGHRPQRQLRGYQRGPGGGSRAPPPALGAWSAPADAQAAWGGAPLQP